MENLKLSSRKTKAMETKIKIFNTAEELFREHGFEKVSVDAIVEKAGVAKGSFYVHFESKNVLITSLIAGYVSDLDLNYRSYLASFPLSASASEILLSLGAKIADILANSIGHELMKIAYETLLTSPINSSPIIGYDRELYKIFNTLIDKGIQQGEFQSDRSSDTIAKHFVLCMRGITFEWCIRHPDFNLKHEFLNHFGILLIGIKKR